jgi:branched-chain amino acid transport system ATP-binding protein
MFDVLLKVENLSAAYGGIKAINDVSLEVKKGEIVSVLGANGAGKTTLLKCISSAMKPRSGTISFFGKQIPKKPYETVKAGIAHAPEGRQILAGLTVFENLKIKLYTISNDALADDKLLNVIMDEFNITNLRNHRVAYLSGGERQKIALANTLLSDPDIVLLDEPIVNLDADSKKSIKSLIATKLKYKTVVVVTHEKDILLDEYIPLLLKDGKLIYE